MASVIINASVEGTYLGETNITVTLKDSIGNEIVFVKTNGVSDKIYEELSSPFDFHEIGYFIHIINKHIQTNMCTK